MATGSAPSFRQQLESLHSISIEIAQLHELQSVLDRALGYCLDLTNSDFGFVGLMNGEDRMDVAAIKGFQPLDPHFYERFRLIPVRPSVFGIVITEGHSNLSNDVLNDPRRAGQPEGHPPVRTFLGVPLKVAGQVIGMIGVANKPGGYTNDEERLLTTFANQVAVAVDNARLYESQRAMIARLELLGRELDQVEREQVRAKERERIAADIHDQIGQSIFTIGLKVNAMLERPNLAAGTRASLEEVRGLTAGSAEAVREVIFALSLPGPQAGRLVGALRTLVRETGRSNGLETDLVVAGEVAAVGAEVERVLFNVAKEALNNVVRHSAAKMALASLRYSAGQIELAVQDDGSGASELILGSFSGSSTHFGLKGIRRQAEAIGGVLEVANGEEGGLVLKVRLPVTETAAQ